MPLEALADDDELSPTADTSVDVPASESRDDNMEAVGAEPGRQQAAVAVHVADQTVFDMDEEASRKGYGKAYAAFGGGREGLEACAASEPLHSRLLGMQP